MEVVEILGIVEVVEILGIVELASDDGRLLVDELVVDASLLADEDSAPRPCAIYDPRWKPLLEDVCEAECIREDVFVLITAVLIRDGSVDETLVVLVKAVVSVVELLDRIQVRSTSTDLLT